MKIRYQPHLAEVLWPQQGFVNLFNGVQACLSFNILLIFLRIDAGIRVFGLINSVQRDNVVYWKEPKGRSKMISNATNPLKESQKESLLGCAGYASIYA